MIVLTPQQKQQQNGFTQLNTNNNSNNVYPKHIIPKNVIIKSEPMTKSKKDDQRRLTHKEGLINLW